MKTDLFKASISEGVNCLDVISAEAGFDIIEGVDAVEILIFSPAIPLLLPDLGRFFSSRVDFG